MASSQVEIASSSPFGCVLRDRNQREACRESNVKCTHHHHHHHHATFERNMKNFVIDLNTCMVVSSDSATNENDDDNSKNKNKNKNKGINQRKAPKNHRLERLRFTRAHSFNNDNNQASLTSLISPRLSRLLDRWDARQAREMVSNLENEAELLSMDDNDMFPRTSSSTSEEESPPNMVASSLVQIWEKRLNQSGVSKTNASAEKIGSATSPTSENVNASPAEEECFDGPSGNDEGSSLTSSFPEWESSDHSLSPNGRSESGVSVANIIKKLITCTNQNHSPTPSVADENEHEGYTSSSIGSPCRERECAQQQPFEHKITCPFRIRGRQAFNDLLMQMENDRRRELNKVAERGAVSRFAQRGRIQALLRLKLLQRGVAANDRSLEKSTSSEVINRQPQGSAIMQLRERFSIGVELRNPVQAEVANPRSPQKETVNKTKKLGNSATNDQLRKDTRNQTAHCSGNHATGSTQKSVSQTRIDQNTEKAPPSSDVMVQETLPRSDAKALHKKSKETSEATTSMVDPSLNEMTDRAETSNQQNAMTKSSNDEKVNEEEASNQQYAESSYQETIQEASYQETIQEASYQETIEEEASNQNYAESSYDNGMEEEEEEIDQNCGDETNYDWISEISRPRSYWEELRQAWYTEMLETGSHNEDIRRLLERRTVSSFLSSDFRDRMDRLMESHRGTQAHLVNCQAHEENSQGLMAFLQERLHSARTSQEDGRGVIEEEEEERSQEEEEEEERSQKEEEEERSQKEEEEERSQKEEEEERSQEEEEEEEADNADEQEHEEESFISGSYHEAGDRSSSWSYRDNEAGDYFDRTVSSSPQTYQSQSSYQDSRHSPSTNHHSMEMELIYDLRGHMEQLYNEISALRKTIKGCMDMQMELQQTMKQEVHSVKKEKKSRNRIPKKGNCCICYEVKADSVLYRCGHMCACLKCAVDLQFNSGKCPICRAKIVDVVRVYIDG